MSNLDIDFGAEEEIFSFPEESDDDEFRPIPEKDWIPELEETVARYVSIAGKMPKNDIIYETVKVPQNLDVYGFERWAKEEIRRCKEGHNGLCGKYYFYFNYCKIQAIGKKISPKFRVIDNLWMKLVEKCQASKEWGIICVKRRRVGASWKSACDVLHDCIFNKHFKVGMNSKSERDSLELFKKVKYMYENLPPFLRVRTTAGNTKSSIDFSYYTKDQNGNKIKKGNDSNIVVVAPTDNAYEGLALGKLVCDEAGKIKNLSTMWSYSEDCLLVETRRVGIPIIFGTAGDIGAEGKDLQYMWEQSEKYRLKKFFFPGWAGLCCDAYGNDDIVSAIRWIVYERHKREGLRPEEMAVFLQKYPLSVSEAFTVTQGAGVGDLVKIRAQMQSLRENPSKSVRGFFRILSNDEVEWVPSAQGKVIIYEHPQKDVESLYIGGCDPADHDEVSNDASDLSLFIMKRPQGLNPAHIVCEYTDRPTEVVEFYEQALFCSIYYNRCKILVERNRYLMIQHFKATGNTHLLARTPIGVARITGGRADTVGIQMTPAAKDYLKGCIGRYVKDYVSWIPSKTLLEEFLYFGAKNTDKAMAFGIALIYLDDYKTPIYNKDQLLSKAPHFGFKRNNNGSIERIKYQKKPGALEGYKGGGMDLGEKIRVKPVPRPSKYTLPGNSGLAR